MPTNEELYRMATGYITAALWSDAMPLCTCGSNPEMEHDGDCRAGESGGLDHLDVRAEDYFFVVNLCREFATAAGADLDTFANLRELHGYDRWECVGHDLRLTSAGHGTGFWDRDPDVDSLPCPSERSNERILEFYGARNRLNALAATSPFHRDGGGDVWQATPETCEFDPWPLDADAAPGDRWTCPSLTSAQRQAFIETGVVPFVEDTLEVGDAGFDAAFREYLATTPDHGYTVDPATGLPVNLEKKS
jgi:hypothetical protein